MKNLLAIVQRFQPRRADVLGLDLGSSGVKAVRIRRIKGVLTVVAAGSFPPIPVGASSDAAPLPLPKALRARYVALAIPGATAAVKLLTLPVAPDKGTELSIRQMMSLGEAEADYRIAYEILTDAHARGETRVLAVAVPAREAEAVTQRYAIGFPAPCSLEVSGLAMLTAYQQGPGQADGQEAVAILDFGAHTSLLAVFVNGTPALVRKFDYGAAAVTQKVQETLGVDAETAEGILADGSFDVSQPVATSIEGFTRQVLISRDFVERRENCHLNRVYVSGGLAASRDWLAEMSRALGIEVTPWNPFAGLAVAPGAIPSSVQGQENRYAAAVGAALGAMEAP